MMKERFVTENSITTVTTVIEEREVSYDDVLESVSIENDDWSGEAPWESCDGWEHEARQLGYYDHEGLEDGRGYARTHRHSPNVLIEIDEDDIVNEWGCNGYPGASKQVRAELIAQVKRNALDQLVKWYEDGWEYYSVCGGFNGCTDSLGGIDCVEDAEEMRRDVCNEICKQLESEGYIIIDRPAPNNRSDAQMWHDRYKWRIAQYVVQPR
jgi:hypothetical protein